MGMIWSLIKMFWYCPSKRAFHGLYREIFQWKVYKPDWKDVHTIVDIGANIGMFALYARNHAPTADIECYEPQLEACRCIRKSLGIQAMPVAITDSNSPILISADFEGDPGATRYGIKKNYTRALSIQAKLIINKNTDLVKIDVEGGEYDILSSVNLRFIRKLLIELHKDFRCNECLDIIRKNFKIISQQDSEHTILIYAER
jgi:FkbM family methyltransferase